MPAPLVHAAGPEAEVAWAEFDSPLGRLVLAATTRGLARLAYADQSVEPRDRARPAGGQAARHLEAARRELGEYFAGDRRRFDVDLDLPVTPGFRSRVLAATAAIPYGTTATYGDVAAGAGNGRAVRAAGSALRTNPVPIVVPCHRVVRSGGAVGSYAGGPGRKLELLRLEGAVQ